MLFNEDEVQESPREKVRAESGDWSLVEEMKGTSWIDGGGDTWSQTRALQVEPVQPFGIQLKSLIRAPGLSHQSAMLMR